MNLYQLHQRIIQTIGSKVTTVESLNVMVKNCFADLTSRGYRLFNESEYTIIKQDDGRAVIKAPERLRKTLYCHVFFDNGVVVYADRLTLTGCNDYIPVNSVGFYMKGEEIVLRWNQNYLGSIKKILIGYHQSLVAPKDAVDDRELEQIELNIRSEFEDAVVFYGVYFYLKRQMRSKEEVGVALNQYKYYVEDLLHELAYEDSYNTDMSISEE